MNMVSYADKVDLVGETILKEILQSGRAPGDTLATEASLSQKYRGDQKNFGHLLKQPVNFEHIKEHADHDFIL